MNGVHLWSHPDTSTLYANLVDDVGGYHIFQGSGVLTLNKYQHVAVTYSKASGIAKLYVDGVEVASSNFGSFNLETDGDLYIGLRPSVSFGGTVVSFRGEIDEARIYGHALSGAEIDALAAELRSETIDQRVTGQFTFGAGFGGLVGGSQRAIGQEFVPNLASLTGVDLAISASTPGDVTVEIRDGAFDGTIIGTVTQKVFSTASVPPFTHFPFPQPLSLVPGQTYVIRVSDVSMGNPGALGISGNPYILGRMLRNFAGNPDADDDLMFRTYAPLTNPFGWGYNSFGQVGDGAPKTRQLTPVAVSDLTDVLALAAGATHSLALRSDGTVWAWGQNNTSGDLGTGNFSNSSVPVQVVEPGDPTGFFSNAIAVRGGNLHSIALKSDGTVWTWGNNASGQLGIGAPSTFFSNVPIQVVGPDFLSDSSSVLTDVVAIASGLNHSLALRSDGTILAWGNNTYGQLGNGASGSGSIDYFPVPVTGLGGRGVVEIGTGYNHSFALISDGTVRSWGYNFAGALGDGTTTNSSTPVTVAGLSGAIALEGGLYHSLALKADGTVQS